MKKTKQLITKAFSCSRKPGIVMVKRFSKSGVNVRRFSMDGEVELDETITDPELTNVGTDEVVSEVPAEEVAVFSAPEEGVDEIVAEVDGGDATPIIEDKQDDGYVEDTVEVQEDEPAVAQNCDNADISESLKAFSKGRR